MARAPRQAFEGWPSWSKLGFLIIGIFMIVLGIWLIISDRHQGVAALGVVNIVLALPFLYGFLFSPKWTNNPEGSELYT